MGFFRWLYHKLEKENSHNYYRTLSQDDYQKPLLKRHHRNNNILINHRPVEFKIYTAESGFVIDVSYLVKSNSNSLEEYEEESRLYIIDSFDKLGEEVSKILTTEMLRN